MDEKGGISLRTQLYLEPLEVTLVSVTSEDKFKTRFIHIIFADQQSMISHPKKNNESKQWLSWRSYMIFYNFRQTTELTDLISLWHKWLQVTLSRQPFSSIKLNKYPPKPELSKYLCTALDHFKSSIKEKLYSRGESFQGAMFILCSRFCFYTTRCKPYIF